MSERPLLARAWMHRWTKRGKPVRWVVRHDGRLVGFADQAELCAFLDATGLDDALDLHKGNHDAHTAPAAVAPSEPPADAV